MNCETDDCRREKRGCKGCYYDEGKENTLSELETNKKAVDNLLVKNAELKQELETYKKIAEKLAEYSIDIENYTPPTIAELIDWTRKEVEKDE